MESVIFYFAVITAFLTVVIIAGQCISPEKSYGKLILTLFLVCIGICQGYHAMMIRGLLLEYPHFSLIHAPFLYLLGPVTYFYFKSLVHDNVVSQKKNIIHFLPGLLVLGILIPFYIQEASWKKVFLATYPDPIGKNSFPAVYLALLALFSATAIFYMIFFFKNNTFLFNKKSIKIKNIVYLSHGIILSVFLNILIYIIGTSFSNLAQGGMAVYLLTIRIIIVVTGIMILMIFFMDRRYPDYFKQIKNGMDSIRYQKSRIEGLDVEAIESELTRLMEQEHIYCDEELTLKRLAADLNIASYQLSQILNQNMNQNFNTYINVYRINDARRTLLDEPERNISSIAYAVGFNSSSAFYDWFLKLTGTTPAKFRAANL